jgi:hypothetical protein
MQTDDLFFRGKMEIKNKYSYMGLLSCGLCIVVAIAIISINLNRLINLIILIIITVIALILGLIAKKHANKIGDVGFFINLLLMIIELLILAVGIYLLVVGFPP